MVHVNIMRHFNILVYSLLLVTKYVTKRNNDITSLCLVRMFNHPPAYALRT